MSVTAVKQSTQTPLKTFHAADLKFGNLIQNPSPEDMRAWAKKDERTTEFGSPSYTTKFKSRAAQFTRTTVDGTLTDQDLTPIDEAKEYLKTADVIQLDRRLGNKDNAYHCRLYVTKAYARLGLMFYHSLGPIPASSRESRFTTVDIPEFPGERRILVDTISGITFVLGSDYYGEIKKSFLRQFMYAAKVAGHLGLHAGSKEVWAKSHKTGKIQRKGLLFFGLSGTGKTSLTCHEYGLNEADGEYIRVRQDDVVAIHPDGFCEGSEPEGFYIKTEGLNPVDQKALYQAARSPVTVFENVHVDENGKVDFDDTTTSSNGRAVAPIKEVMFTDGDIDMPSTNVMFFITRNPLVPPIARLTPAQGAAAFMLGESIKTSAADPSAKGEPVREVGTNPFIVGNPAEEGNRVMEILKGNPQIEVYLLNTGHMGYGDKRRKIQILETVSIIRELCRDGIEWEKDEHLNFEVPKTIEGLDPKLFRLSNYFETIDFDRRLLEIRKERKIWMDSFQGLDPEIQKAIY